MCFVEELYARYILVLNSLFTVVQILLVGPGDYAASGGTSRCIQMVQKAAGNRQSRLMFTPTLFWVDKNFQQRKSVNSQVDLFVTTPICSILFDMHLHVMCVHHPFSNIKWGWPLT